MKTKSIIPIVTAITVSLFVSALAESPKLDVTIQVANPVLLAGQKGTNYVKVGLTGFERTSENERSPVNIALVLDRSGSMSGDKIRYAKDAARMAVKMLQPDDIFSLITYESTVEVVVPATKVSDRATILKAIDSIAADGSTALFGGVSKGAAEVRKFLSNERVNSVILLSDGMANVGPQSASELGDLGKSLVKAGISVNTLGLGLDYNEDLMLRLAEKSDGIHRFIQEPQQLVAFFQEEFDNVMAVVAQQVDITIECAPEIRPVRVLGREAEIAGQKVHLKLNQIYSKEEKYVLLEVETPALAAESVQSVASVTVQYNNLASKAKDLQTKQVSCRYSAAAQDVELAVNEPVLLSCVTQIATDSNEKAMRLRDLGKVQEAKDELKKNVEFLYFNEARFKDNKAFGQISGTNMIGRDLIDDDQKWGALRKRMRVEQNYFRNGQSSKTSGDIDKAIEESQKQQQPSSSVKQKLKLKVRR